MLKVAAAFRPSIRFNSTFTPQTTTRGHRWQWLLGGFTVVGSAYLAKILHADKRAEQDPKHYYSDWKIRVYTSLPLATISRFAGTMSTVPIPVPFRNTLFGWYAKVYDCRMDEAIHCDFKHYNTFAEFFNRPLLPTARPISSGPMVSPADGTVLHVGEINEGRVEYVKGHDYEVTEFLGPTLFKIKPGNRLLQAVIYLAPGDYHAFHSPVQWKCKQEVHFPGHLLSVRPTILEKIPLLFCINERTVLTGQWRHGFFSMAAVAATNVGDISIANSNEDGQNSVDYNVGQKVGEFRLGSTIVLIFEASPNAKFAVSAGEKLKFGQSLLLEE